MLTGDIQRWAACLMLLLIGGCAGLSPTTSKRATLVLASGDILRGGASTTINGQYFVKNERVNCYGSYDGRSVAGMSLTLKRPAPVTVRCSNGKGGSSQDDLWHSGAAELIFSDGSKGRLSLEDNGD